MVYGGTAKRSCSAVVIGNRTVLHGSHKKTLPECHTIGRYQKNKRRQNTTSRHYMCRQSMPRFIGGREKRGVKR
nr:MAG TPA: hypothetical protein [Caudoviricetes sp.]